MLTTLEDLAPRIAARLARDVDMLAFHDHTAVERETSESPIARLRALGLSSEATDLLVAMFPLDRRGARRWLERDLPPATDGSRADRAARL